MQVAGIKSYVGISNPVIQVEVNKKIEKVKVCCYLNSFVQCLYTIPLFRWSILNYTQIGDQPVCPTIKALKEIFEFLERGVTPSPLPLLESMPEGPDGRYKQKCVYEFAIELLSILNENMKFSPFHNLIRKLFGFTEYSKPTPHDKNIAYDKEGTLSGCQYALSLPAYENHFRGCLNVYFEGSATMDCGHYGNIECDVSTRLLTLPPFLVVNFKREVYITDGPKMRQVKLNQLIG